MTPKQIQKKLDKISKIKKALAADKKRWGGYYDDSSGLRYLPPEIYLQLNDYAGALRYFKWFDKNFPDDIGYPIFLFEWTVALFKTANFKRAEALALKTFFSNSYIFAKFLDQEFVNLDKDESSNWEKPELTENLKYSKNQVELQDFAVWITGFLLSEKFKKFANEFVEIEKRLKSEPVGPTRTKLVERKYNLLEEYDN